MEDIIIIGAGVTGSFLAHDLAKYNLAITVIEKDNDVGDETSMANSAIVHSGYDPEPGTLKAILNVKGNAMYDDIVKELGIPFSRIGSITVALNQEQLDLLESLKERSKVNGVDVKILSKEELLQAEPNVNKEALGGLLAPSAGIIDPFLLTWRLMESAVSNGVKLCLNETVESITKDDEGFVVKTSKNIHHSKMVINCTGVCGDKVASLFEEVPMNIIPRKGEYFVLDHYHHKDEGLLVNHVLFPVPTLKGKGVLVSVSTSGNYIVGPSAEATSIDDKSTDVETLNNVKKMSQELIPGIPFYEGIRTFAGLRATPSTHDFYIKPASKDDMFINAIGIESPGLASSPAISEYVINNFIEPKFKLNGKAYWNSNYSKWINLKALSIEEKNKFIAINPDYGRIICLCEKVSLGEIKDSLSSYVPARSIKGVKKRTRAGFGKCQG